MAIQQIGAPDDPTAPVKQAKPAPTGPNINTIPNTAPVATTPATSVPQGASGAPPMTPPAPMPPVAATPTPQTPTPALAPASPVASATVAPLPGVADPNNHGELPGQPGFNPYAGASNVHAPTDLMGRPLGPNGVYDPSSVPETRYGTTPTGQAWQNLNGTGVTDPSGKPIDPMQTYHRADEDPTWGKTHEWQPGEAWGGAGNAGGYTTSSGSQGPTPGAANINTIPNTPALAPAGPSAAPNAPPSASSPAPAPTSASPAPGVALSTINPEADLRSQNVLPTNGPDRFQIAKDRWKNYTDQALPELQAKTREATQSAAANGQTGSGMFRTRLGDLDLAAQRDANAKQSDLLSGALEGTIGDQRNNRDEFRTERGRQDALEGQSYDRGVQGLTLEDALTNSAFGRSQAQNQAGQANNPANTSLLLSQIFGDQSTGAGKALSDYIRTRQANSTAAGGQTGSNVAAQIAAHPDWLNSILAGSQSL